MPGRVDIFCLPVVIIPKIESLSGPEGPGVMIAPVRCRPRRAGRGFLSAGSGPAKTPVFIMKQQGGDPGAFGEDLRILIQQWNQPNGPFSKMVAEVFHHVNEHYGSIKSVTGIASDLGHNYHTLRSRFRRETQMTLEEFLARTRVVRALELILETDLLIKEIAWEVGYRYEDQLARAMKKWLGFTPQIVRRQHLLTRSIARCLSRARRFI